LSVAAIGCVHDTRDLHAVRRAPARAPSGVANESWGVCSLIGPHNRNPGVWGADLGLSARTYHDQQLTFLFGDTWASPIDGCQYSPSPDNDLQATLPVARPPQFQPGPPPRDDARACDVLEYVHERGDDVTSWRRARLFPSPRAMRDEDALDMSGLRTPLTTFSDGERILSLFQRNDPVKCSTHADCPGAMQCTGDPSYSGALLGECTRLVAIQNDPPPDYCRDDNDCITGASCEPAQQGVCVATRPFEADTPRGRIAPSWYRDDIKRALASDVYVAAALWPERPADYATIARFATNRFQNVTARTVAYFDPDRPEHNDYRAGYHTLLLWGRSAFVEFGGAQALPFFAYLPLSELRGDPEHARWHPRFFAGYDAAGHPAWSERESDAQPIYGDEASVSATDRRLEFSEPEFDQVAQMSVSWVAPLSRWVMFYGGDLPAFMVAEAKSGKTRDPVHLQFAPGAIHMRVAAHPWGAAHAGVAADGGEAASARGWSSPEPVLTRERAAPYLACGSAGPEELPGCVEDHEPFRPLAVLGALASHIADPKRTGSLAGVASTCLTGELERAFQDELSGDPIGRLYAPNIIEEWTQDVTDPAARERGDRSAEVYWNVSTWNPYQVALFKTRLSTRLGANEATSTASLLASPRQQE
jgi:hypothetical protein